MSANIPVPQQQQPQPQQIQGNAQNSTNVPVTMVNAMPMGIPPPLAQLTPTMANTVPVQSLPIQVQNTLATNSMQVPSVVPSSTPVATSSSITGSSTVVQQVQQVVTTAPATSSKSTPTATVTSSSSTAASSSTSQNAEKENTLVSRIRLQDLVREVDAAETLDDEVEDLLLQLADDFVESTVNAACMLAKHRKASNVEVRDVQLHLERNWNMWTPGFGTDELRPYKRAPVTEAHKQRLALIRRAIKKY